MEKIKMKIKYKDKTYNINFDKVKIILSKLTNKNIEIDNYDTILKLMKEYNLFDEYFLKTINKL